jgi:uncharacterized damage-inducible protein DinB
MQVSQVELLYDYSEWATARILAQAAHLSHAQWTQASQPGYGSLRATLLHTLDTEWSWRMLCQFGQLTPALEEADFPTVEALAERWAQDRAEMRAYLASLTDTDLQDVIRYSVEGVPRERVLWPVMLHISNHSTQHRSEAAALLTGFGHSPGDLDLMDFIRERSEVG